MLLPGDRKHEALMPVLGVRVNVTIQSLRRFSCSASSESGRSGAPSPNSSNGWRSGHRPSSNRSSSCPGATSRRSRSSRSFLREPSVILAYEPTQGVDVGSRFDIYKALRSRTDRRNGDARQVERPHRARGAVRSRAGDVPGPDHRGDPRRRARRAAHRRGDGARAGPVQGRAFAPRGRDAEGDPRRTGGHERHGSRLLDAPSGRSSATLATRTSGARSSRFRLWMPVVLQILLVAALLSVHQLAVPRFHQRDEHLPDPHPGAAPDRRGHGAEPCAPRRVPRSLGRRHDQPRGGHRFLPDRRRGLRLRDLDRHRVRSSSAAWRSGSSTPAWSGGSRSPRSSPPWPP